MQMFNSETIKHLLLLQSDQFEDRCSPSLSSPPFYLYSRISNMNIGTWPLENEDLTCARVQTHEMSWEEKNRLFWTKALLQTSSYDEKRYQRIASNASGRLVRSEIESKSQNLTPLRTATPPIRSSSIVAVSLSETSTRQSSSSKNRSTSRTIPLSMNNHRKISSSSATTTTTKHSERNQLKKKLPMKSNDQKAKNNNNYLSHDDRNRRTNLVTKKVLKLSGQCRNQMCSTCLKLLERRENEMSSKLLCSSCLHLIRHWNETKGENIVRLSKAEEKELRQIIELVLEEFQDHFGHALNLSLKQMTQHLLANINLFYNHYQHEFEQLAKKYRLTFLDRFLQWMKKNSNGGKFFSKATSITRPPDLLSLSSLSGSLITEKDLTETIAQLTSPSNSFSMSTPSKDSMLNNEKKCQQTRRKYPSIGNSSSKKTFTLNRSRPVAPTSFSKSRKPTSSSLPLLDAYRFRDTLHMRRTPFTPARGKFRNDR